MSKSTRRKRQRAPQAKRPTRDSAEYDRRLRAAGLRSGDPEPEPEDEESIDIDAFRYKVARMIAMFINDWKGCPERMCRRQRGCMAPRHACENHKPLPPDPDGRRLSELLALVRRTFDEANARDEARDAFARGHAGRSSFEARLAQGRARTSG